MKKRLLIIPARSGSKRIKNKNIKLFQKKPIIYFPLKEAKKSKLFKKIHVSTDSKKIKKLVENFGVKVDFLRPKKLAGDKISTEQVLRYVVKEFEKKSLYFDEIWSITPCSPLVTASDLLKASKKLKKNMKKIILSVAKYPVPIDWAFERKNDCLIPLKRALIKKDHKILKICFMIQETCWYTNFFFKSKKINFDKIILVFNYQREDQLILTTLKILS